MQNKYYLVNNVINSTLPCTHELERDVFATLADLEHRRATVEVLFADIAPEGGCWEHGYYTVRVPDGRIFSCVSGEYFAPATPGM